MMIGSRWPFCLMSATKASKWAPVMRGKISAAGCGLSSSLAAISIRLDPEAVRLEDGDGGGDWQTELAGGAAKAETDRSPGIELGVGVVLVIALVGRSGVERGVHVHFLEGGGGHELEGWRLWRSPA